MITKIIKSNAQTILVISLLAIIYFCLSTALSSHFISYKGYYGYLADGFMHRQTSLLVKPNPKLFELKDVYDPGQNYGLRLHDASFYKGKYYLYWGPVPAFVRILFLNKLPEGFFVALYVFICSATAYFIIKRIKTEYFNRLSWLHVLVGFCFIAFNGIVIDVLPSAGVYPYNGVYYEAIAAAQAFLLIGLYFILSFFIKQKHRDLFIANIFFGLSIASRASYLLPVIVFLLFEVYLIFYDLFHPLRQFKLHVELLKTHAHKLRSFLFILSPIILTGIALAWYNYARFGRITEFGITYQLAAVYVRKIVLSSILYVPNNIKNYLLGIPSLGPKFPYLYVDPTNYMNIENIVFSVFIISPICLLAFKIRSVTGKVKEFSLFLVAACLLIFLTIATLQTSVIRYMFDFIYLLSLIAIIVFFDISTKIQNRKPQKIIFVTLTILSFCVMIFFSSLFWFTSIIEYHPDQYANLSGNFYGYYIRATVAVYHLTGNPALVNKAILVTGFFNNQTNYVLKDTTVNSPTGIDVTSDGERLWVGNAPASFTVLSLEKQPHSVMLSIPMTTGPSSSTPDRAVQVKVNNDATSYAFSGTGVAKVPAVILPGNNIVSFTVTSPNGDLVDLPNDDLRHLLIRMSPAVITNQ